MLLVWLFGVVTGVANACWAQSLVLPAGQHPLAVGARAAVAGEPAQPECEFHCASRQVGPDSDGPDTQDLHAKTVCQTYCDGVGVSISTLKSSVDSTPAPAMAVASFPLALPVAGVAPVHLLMPRRDGGQAPPITIAFLRLAL